eukprot:1945221-Lingulodinium_polyedra.AAC.1
MLPEVHTRGHKCAPPPQPRLRLPYDRSPVSLTPVVTISTLGQTRVLRTTDRASQRRGAPTIGH